MAEILLASRVVSAHTVKFGATTTTLPAGKHLKVESSPAGEEYFDGVVPTGKQWEVYVSVQIVETDV